MKIRKYTVLGLVLALGLGFGITASAQSDDPYAVSSWAGTINLADNGTEICQNGNNDWHPASSRQRLNNGDSLRTYGNAQAEMLLNPGSFLRLAGNTEVELTDGSLDQMFVTVRRGAVIFEITGTDGTELVVRVSTPGGDFYILQAGVYRVQVGNSGQSEIRISQGQIELADNGGTRINGRRRVILQSSGIRYGDYGVNDRDDFDNWSRNRGILLIDANSRLNDYDAQQLVIGYQSGGSRGFGYAPNFGLWIFNIGFGGYTFYPFYDNWSSPYGRRYSYGYRLPWSRYRPAVMNSYPQSWRYRSPGYFRGPVRPRQPVAFPRLPGRFNSGPTNYNRQPGQRNQPGTYPSNRNPGTRDRYPTTRPTFPTNRNPRPRDGSPNPVRPVPPARTNTPPDPNRGNRNNGTPPTAKPRQDQRDRTPNAPGRVNTPPNSNRGGRNPGGSPPAAKPAPVQRERPQNPSGNPPPNSNRGGRNNGGSPPAAKPDRKPPQSPRGEKPHGTASGKN